MGLREFFDRWSGRVKDDYRSAGLAMSGTHAGFTSEQRRQAADQQWRTVHPKREHVEHVDRVYPWSAEQAAVERLSKDLPLGANDGVHLLRQPIDYRAVVQEMMEEVKAEAAIREKINLRVVAGSELPGGRDQSQSRGRIIGV